MKHPHDGDHAVVDEHPVLERLRASHPVRAGLVGPSAELARLFDRIQRLAESAVPVLILGEIGSGKENVARALHLNSNRSTGPFVAEAGSCLREPFFVRHLFGHCRGAFTGAASSAPGLIEVANGGTLYLDEVADLPLEAQGCLLRVLDGGEYRPLGSAAVRRSDFRLVASSSVDLAALVRSGMFRRDLYFRLRGAILEVPPLRQRRPDILPLAEEVLRESGRRGKPAARLSEEASAALLSYDWPGNVRELRHELRQAMALCRDGSVTPADFQFLRTPPPPVLRPPTPGSAGLRSRISEVEALTIRDALRLAGGNKAEAARRLGITRRTLYRRLAALSGVNDS